MEKQVPGTAGGTHVAGAPLTTQATAAAAPELLRNAIDSHIVKIRPMATPLDQISRMGAARRCGSMTVEYYSVDTKKTESSVKTAVDFSMAIEIGPGVSALPIDVADPTIFDVSETVLFPDVRRADGTPAVGYIIGITDTGTLQVVPVDDDEVPDWEMPKGTRVIRMGRAATELDVQTAQFQALPVKASNNCQIFKMQVEQSTLQRMADKEVGWTLSDQEEAAVIDMRLGMEKSFLFGRRGRVRDVRKNEYVYLTGGIWNQCRNEVKVNLATLGHADLVDICGSVFKANCGSRAKIMLAGSDLIAALSKLPLERTLEVRDCKARWGLEVREIVSTFGRMYLIHSEIFDACGHAADGLIIDPAYVTKYTHIPFHAEKLDLRRSGTRNTDAVVLTEASCLVLRYPAAHARVVGTR